MIKGYGFFLFTESISKTLRGKYSQKPIHHAKKSATEALKTASKRAIQEKAEETGKLFGNKIADKITRDLKTSPKIIQKQRK